MDAEFNLFEVLEVDPSVEDPNTLRERLREKQHQWASDTTTGNPRRRREAKRNLERVGELERLVVDPAEIREHAATERQRRDEERKRRIVELNEAIELIRATRICDEESFEGLVRDFADLCSRGEIEKRLRAAGVERQKSRSARKRPRAERIDDTMARQIRRNLDHLRAKTLYDFLDRAPQSSPAALRDRAEEILGENRRLGKTDSKASAENELAGIAKIVFKDDGGKSKYDTYLAVEAMEGLKRSIERAGEDGRITRHELEVLLKHALKRGVAPVEAREYIEEQAELRGWFIEGEEEETLPALRRCGFCSTVLDATHAKCTGCGEPLELECPRCGARNPTDNAACPSCGCRIGDAPLVQALVSEGERLVLEGDLIGGVSRFERALHYWPGWERAEKAAARARELQAAREREIEVLESLLGKRHLVAARTAFEKLRRSFGRGGLETIATKIEEGVRRAEAAYEAAERLRIAGRTEEALERYQLALGACADFEPARRAMAASPPPPPDDLAVRPLDGGFRISWTPSSARGELEYRVLRKAGGAPRDAEDGEEVGTVAGRLIDDTAVRSGVAFHYAVFSRRAGTVSSTAARSGPHLRAAEVEHLSARAGDGEVRLSWKAPPGALRVEAWRAPEEPPERPGEGTLLTSSSDGAVDRDLPNDRRVGYRVVTVFSDPRRVGAEIVTPGLTARVTPTAPPPPVLDLTCSRAGETVTLEWSPIPEASVEIRWSRQRSEAPAGLVLAASELGRFGEALHGISAGRAQMKLVAQGRFHFLPVTLREDVAVLGEGRSVVSLDAFSRLAVHRSGNHLALTWSWPEGVEEALVAWTHDAPPADPHDPEARRARVTRREYERTGCWELRQAGRRRHAFTVFAGACDERGATLFSSGVSCVETGGRGLTVGYQVEVKRHWLLRRVEEAWVELDGNGSRSCTLPAMLLVGKPRGVPVAPSDGQRLAEIPSVPLVDGKARLPVPAEHWGRGLYLKLFFEDPTAASEVRLLPAARPRLHLP